MCFFYCRLQSNLYHVYFSSLRCIESSNQIRMKIDRAKLKKATTEVVSTNANNNCCCSVTINGWLVGVIWVVIVNDVQSIGYLHPHCFMCVVVVYTMRNWRSVSSLDGCVMSLSVLVVPLPTVFQHFISDTVGTFTRLANLNINVNVSDL